jgi:hypothetical protein
VFVILMVFSSFKLYLFLIILLLVNNAGFLGPPREIVDLATFLKVKSAIPDVNKQVSLVIDQLQPNLRIILVAIAVSVMPGSSFNSIDATGFVNTYCAHLKLDHVTQSQTESAIEFFKANGIIGEVSSTIKKLGKGHRHEDAEKVSILKGVCKFVIFNLFR